MKFPSRLLGSQLWLAGLIWIGFVVVVALIATGVAIFGTLEGSAWEVAAQFPRWYALFIGVALMREFLPLYIAHGQTRREFGAQAAVTVSLFAAFLAVLLVAGYLLESLIYRMADLDPSLSRTHLFAEPTQVHLVFLEYLIRFLTWTVAGALMGAAFYRWEGGGLLSLPVGVAMILVGEEAVGFEPLPRFIGRITDINLDIPDSMGFTLGAGFGVFVLGLALTWLIIRDTPLRNKPA
jgi:hypothetical protein